MTVSKKKDKKTKRSRTKNPGLDKKLFSKIKQQAYEDDPYLKKLKGADAEWMSQFLDEYIGANLQQKKPLHKTRKLRKSVFDANNARQRDIRNLAHVTNRMYYEQEIPKGATIENWRDPENIFVKQLKYLDEIRAKKRNKKLFQNCKSLSAMLAIAETDEERNIVRMLQEYVKKSEYLD